MDTQELQKKIERIQELQNKIESIERLAKLQKKAVYYEYVRENARFKIGDMLEQCGERIIVEQIGFTLINGIPEIHYKGTRLTKQGKPRKDGDYRYFYDKNPIKLC